MDRRKKKKDDDDCPASFCTYLPCGEWKRFQHCQERTCHDAIMRVYVSEVQTNLQLEMASICCWPRMIGIISRSAPLLYYDAASVRYFGISHVLSPAIRTSTRGGQQRARTCDQTRPVIRNFVRFDHIDACSPTGKHSRVVLKSTRQQVCLGRTIVEKRERVSNYALVVGIGVSFRTFQRFTGATCE